LRGGEEKPVKELRYNGPSSPLEVTRPGEKSKKQRSDLRLVVIRDGLGAGEGMPTREMDVWVE